jgi:hypothetical protein
MNSQNRCFRAFCFNVVVLLVVLGGCSVPTISTAEPDHPTPMPIIQSVMPGPTPPMRTLELTSIPPTWAPSPPPESPTPAPTLTASEEQASVLDLLQSNEGCQLPCWWGFTPGETNWQAAQAFFTSLGKIPHEYLSPRGTINYSVDLHISMHDVGISQVYIVRNHLIEGIWVRTGTTRNDERVYGDPLFLRDLQRYLPSQLLASYGQPTQVFLRTFYSAPEGSFVPFNLLLFYPEQGILVRYYGPTEREGDLIRVCPRQTDITLWLWSPKEPLTLEDIAQWGQQFPIEEVSSFRTLKEATGWSIEQFYQTFVQSDTSECFETPAGIWKNR